MKSKIVVVLSGGLDSTVLLNQCVREAEAMDAEVHALSIYYGQRHDRELQAAGLVCDHLHVKHKVLELGQLKTVLEGSSQTDDRVDVPHGHYAAENMKITVVPNRNMILLSIAVGFAISIKAKSVCYGAHAGDHAIYPDCRQEFVDALRGAIRLCDEHPPLLLAPFTGLTKAAIVNLGAANGAPMHLSYSCYEGERVHCGRCGTCVERREAFELARVPDPTVYSG